MPTVAELGYKDFSFVSYYGVLAPAGLPRPVLTRLNTDFNTLLARDDVRQALGSQGLEANPMSPDAFSAMIKEDIQKTKATIETAGIKVE